MFWIEYRREDGTTYVSSSEGLAYGEREAAKANPNFVREFQGDKFGKSFATPEKAGAKA